MLASARGFCFSHVPEIWWHLASTWSVLRVKRHRAVVYPRKTILVLILANLGNLYYLSTIFLRLSLAVH